MATAMRIAAGGVATEICTFSPLPSELEDFNILRGADLLQRYDFAPGHNDITLFPLFHASAVPGGPVRQSAYEQLKGEFMSGLRDNGPWDGVYLDMHGAVYVAGMEDAEGDWIAAVREIVGPSCPISASYDLHGNVSSKVIENVDLLTAYRSAPHEDAPQTRERAYRLLVRCLREDLRPHKAFVPIPVMLTEVLRLERDRTGVAILLVEQNLRFALSIADSYAVLNLGQIIDRGNDTTAATIEKIAEELSV